MTFLAEKTHGFNPYGDDFCPILFVAPSVLCFRGGHTVDPTPNTPPRNPNSNSNPNPNPNPNPNLNPNTRGLLDCCDRKDSRSLCAWKHSRSLFMERL